MRIAAYARYSSDSQRQASLEDQLRNCRSYASRMGWPAPVEFSDAAISGARHDRPGYQRLLSNAANYDVILVDDLSRLSRDAVEATQQVRRLTFAGVRLIGVSDGVDTGRKSHKADVGLRGLMSEMYLDDLADKTHRGLKGRALAGANAGGLAFGYSIAGTGQREIREDQAEVVRRIFAEYIGGKSPRAIAQGLNADGIASGRGSTWTATAIYPDIKRGVGILANPIYIGQQTWNRSQWIRHPETRRKVRVERPQSEWVTTHHPNLAIIDEETWEAAQARAQGRRHASSAAPARPGRPAKNLLSGLMRCAGCGGPIVVVDRYNYGCAIAKERGTCTNKLRIARRTADDAMLAGIRALLSTDEAFERFRKHVVDALRAAGPREGDARQKLAAAEKIRDNIAAAIRVGILTETTRNELLAAESAIAQARADIEAAAAARPTTLLPRLRAAWDKAVDQLAETARDTSALREALRNLIGETITVSQNENGDPVAEIAVLLPQINMVAGAGFEPATFGL